MTRNTLRNLCLATALTVAALGSAQADLIYHPAPGELGASFNPEHGGALSRAQVQAELQRAMKQPGWDTTARLGAFSAQTAGTPKTREQVRAEVAQGMRNPGWERAGRLGAAWPESSHATARISAH